MSKMDLTALRIRDQLYAVDKGAGKPWAGTVADLVELTGSDKRRVPDAIFQLMDDGAPIEYRNGTITFAGIVPASPEPVTAAALITETMDVVLSYEELANRAKRRASARRQERWAAQEAAGQLTIFDIPDAPAPPISAAPVRIAKPERLPIQSAAALRIIAKEQKSAPVLAGEPERPRNEATERPSNEATERPSNEATVAPLHRCTENSRVGALLGRIANRLADPAYISAQAQAPACPDAPAFPRIESINLNQSMQSLKSTGNNQEPEILPATARAVQRIIVGGPRFFDRPDMQIFDETSDELKAKFPDLCARLREQLAYMRAWGGLSPDEYHGLIDDAQRARSPCAWLNKHITAWLNVKKWHRNWRAKNGK